MAGRTKRPRKMNYSPNRKRITNTKKVNNAVKHYKFLQKREELEGKTIWISNAFLIVGKKLKKYGIKINNIN